MIVLIVLALILLLFSALVSVAEVAFFSLDPKAFDEPAQGKGKKMVAIRSLLHRPKQLLAAILVTNNFVNIAIVLVLSMISRQYDLRIENDELRFLLEVVGISAVILLFGEICPKIYAGRNALRFSKIMVAPILFLERYVLFWIVIPMSRLTDIVEKKMANKKTVHSVDRLSKAIDLSSGAGTTSVDEHKILKGIINFGNTEVRQVMCPRVDIFALSDQLPLSAVMTMIKEKGYSRIPVYHKKKDNIIGILYAKDLLPFIEKKNHPWQNLLRTVFYVPENKKLNRLLLAFQEKKKHLAIVVDEYGGTSGLITLEDIIEEIVGEISDEFDYDKSKAIKKDEDPSIFDARINLKDFFNHLGNTHTQQFDTIRGDADTLAGLLLEIAKRIPKKEEIITYGDVTFKIVAANNRCIETVKVKIKKAKEAAG